MGRVASFRWFGALAQRGEGLAKRLVLSLKFATETGGGVVLFPDDLQAFVRERPFDLDAGDARFDAEQTPAALEFVFVHE